jgi:hypothetical protein
VDDPSLAALFASIYHIVVFDFLCLSCTLFHIIPVPHCASLSLSGTQVVRFSVWDKDPTESEMIGQVSFLVSTCFSALIYRASVCMSACGY